MSSNLLGELVANNGTYFLQKAETEYEGNIDQIIVRGQGIKMIIFITDIEGNYIDVTNDYLQNGKNDVLPDGLRITPKGDVVFTKVQIQTTAEGGSGLELVLSA